MVLNKYVTALFLLLSICLCSCSALRMSTSGTRIDSVREPLPGTKTISVTVSRKKYEEAMQEQGSINRIRLIEIFNRAGSVDGLKEYRLFDVKKGSLCDLLGLKNLDILVAANGYVVQSADIFGQYLTLIPGADKAYIEIRRGGTPLVFNYKFVD